MSRRKPIVLSIVGKSDSGKTTLIRKLLPELRKKKKKVAVAKHCPCGFDLDVEGKDSWKFTQAGAEGTFLSSGDTIAIIRPEENFSNMKERLREYFTDFDIVLTEGYSDESDIEKIEIIRKGIGPLDLPSSKVVAYVSDMPLATNKPVYDPNDIPGIISFIQRR